METSHIVNEKDVGICHYLGDCGSFYGVFKQRYSDFLVSEIVSNGEKVILRDLSVIPPPQDPVSDLPVATPKSFSSKDYEDLQLLSGQRVPDKFPQVTMIKTDGEVHIQKVECRQPPGEVWIDVDGLSKSERSEIHMYIKKTFPEVNSRTDEKDGKKFICCIKKGDMKKKDKRGDWPKSLRYTAFTLYKENVDTLEAINTLAWRLKLKPGLFSYMGTKDRRGKTVQLVAVEKVAPQRLVEAARACRGIEVGDFYFQSSPFKLGQLQGNHFRIVMREVIGTDALINEAVSSLKEKGFINYFGMQRFGTTSLPTYVIGKELLKGNWEQAVKLILLPKAGEASDLAASKEIWQKEKCPKKALSALKPFRRSSVEGHILSGLAQSQKGDWVGALARIPRNMRLLYLHAYQSYIWNQVVSARLAKFGHAVLVGDLVWNKYRKAAESDEMVTEETDCFCEEVSSLADAQNEMEVQEGPSLADKRIQVIKEGENAQYNLSDVLLPLPGRNIIYPQNETRELYSAVLQTDGLSLALVQHRVKAYLVGGTYRQMVVHPKDVSFQVCYYNDPLKSLIASDLDNIRGEKAEDNRLTEGDHKAVILEMRLPASAYATMALREVTKMETSSQFQASLNSGGCRKRALDENACGEEVKPTIKRCQTENV